MNSPRVPDHKPIFQESAIMTSSVGQIRDTRRITTFSLLLASLSLHGVVLLVMGLMGLSGPSYSGSELAQAGVKRISTGGSLARAALGGFARAAQEIRDSGTFNYATEAMSDSQASAFMSPTKHR